jgi:hypothetical protein
MGSESISFAMRITNSSVHGKHSVVKKKFFTLAERLQKLTSELSNINYQLLINCMGCSAVNSHKHPLKMAVCDFTKKKNCFPQVVRPLLYLAPPTTSSIASLEAQSMFI